MSSDNAHRQNNKMKLFYTMKISLVDYTNYFYGLIMLVLYMRCTYVTVLCLVMNNGTYNAEFQQTYAHV
jgi:hypothetical protein